MIAHSSAWAPLQVVVLTTASSVRHIIQAQVVAVLILPRSHQMFWVLEMSLGTPAMLLEESWRKRSERDGNQSHVGSRDFT